MLKWRKRSKTSEALRMLLVSKITPLGVGEADSEVVQYPARFPNSNLPLSLRACRV